MAPNEYLLYFNGKIDGRETRAGVKRKLAATFRLPPELLEGLFQDRPVVVKRGIDYMTAIKYLNAFRRCGAICEIQSILSEPKQPLLPSKDAPSGATIAKALAKSKQRLTEPKPPSRPSPKQSPKVYKKRVQIAPWIDRFANYSKLLGIMMRRLAAFLVDVILLALLGLGLGYLFFDFMTALGPFGLLVGFLGCMAYFSILNSSFGGGRTFGKRLTMLRVVDYSGKPPNLLRSTFRYLIIGPPFFLFDAHLSAALKSSLSLFDLLIQMYIFFSLITIVYLFLFNRSNHRSLHDFLSGTAVVADTTGKPQLIKPVWRGHLLVTAGLGLLTIIFFTIIGPEIAHHKSFLEQNQIRQAAMATGRIRQIKIVSGSILNRIAAHATGFDFVSIHAMARAPLKNPDSISREIVAAILAQNTSLTSEDTTPVNLLLTYGFDLGLAWGGETYPAYRSVAEWKRITMHRERSMTYPVGIISQSKIPTEFEAPTQRKFNRMMHAFLKRNCVTAYDPDTDDIKVPAQAVIEFLNEACRLIAFPEETEELEPVEKNGATLIDMGCRSPLVDLFYGRLLLLQDRIALAGVHLKRARKRLDDDYPAINHFFLLEALGAVNLSQRRPLESQRISKLAIAALADAVVAGEFQTDEIPIVYRLIDTQEGQTFDSSRFGQFFEYIRKYATIDPWLSAIVKGRHEIHLAMQSRGSGPVETVSDQDWLAFQQHLIKARIQLTKAWSLNPQYPEAAALMIPVTNRGFGNPGESEKLWFYRAVNAQMDYMPAYNMLLTSLRPHWGGSHQQLIEFGEECLATGRYDTWVPFIYLKAFRIVGSELKNCNWRAPFRVPKVLQNLETMFENALASPQHEGHREKILTQRALTKAWCGNWGEARRELENIQEHLDPAKGFCGESLSWNSRGWDTIALELAAFNGPLRDDLMEAEAMQLENQTEKAVILFEKVIQKLPDGHPIQIYLWNRVAEIKLGIPSEKIRGPLLHVAAAMDRGDIVELLLDKGIPIKQQDRYGLTPLHYAAEKGRSEMVELLLERGAEIDAGDHLQRTPLVVALANGHPHVAKILLKHDADCHLITSEEFTPFHYAVQGGDEEVLKILLAKGVDINAVNIYGVAPLHMALYEGKAEAARFVIANGGKLDQLDDHQWSPLHLAVANNMPDIAVDLIEAGADINVSMERNWTPLHLAAQYGHETVVRRLLKKGADPTTRLDDGDTPLDVARKSRNRRIEKLLANYTAGRFRIVE
jgi:ankyrin repeat protein/uncharacterized RDD family membrane protein YckC